MTDFINEQEVQDIIYDFLKHVTSKHYQESFEGTGGLDNPNAK